MTLSEYIEKIGDDEAAKIFGVSRRAVQSWRLGDRVPRPKQAQHIVAKTHGLLTLSDIYSPQKKRA